jgi:acetyl-CoA carboxylase biotin carboxyl carrier protein
MNPEEIKELKELIELLKDQKIGEFELDREGFSVRIKFAQESSATEAVNAANIANLGRLLGAQPAPAAAAPAVQPATEDAPPADEDAGLHIVKSPIVGTFYESPSPGASAFVKPGDQVENGQVICIVEAMKLMNEIESDVSGEIVKRLVNNGQPVEYGQPLFAVRPR